MSRAAVIAMAGDLIDAEGIDAFTLSRVAERAGVSQPALYKHVGSVAEVWRWLGLATRTDLLACLVEAGLGRSGPDAVAAVANAWRDFAIQHPGRYRSTDKYPVAGDPELEAAVGRVVDALAACLRGFAMSDDDTLLAALAMRSALHGFASFELGDGNPDRPSVDDVFADLIALLCTGFVGRSQAPGNPG